MDVMQALNEAVACQQRNDPEQAGLICQRILQVQPGQADALHLLGLLSHQCGDDEAAVRLLEEAIRNRKGDGQLYYSKGVVLSRLGRHAEAVAANRRALALDPNLTEARLNQGCALRAQGSLDEAASVFEEAKSASPGDYRPYFNLGNVRAAQGLLEKAVEAYDCAVRLCPKFAPAHNNLGNLYKENGAMEKAAEAYRAALNTDPDFSEAARNLVSCMRYESAEHDDARIIRALLSRSTPRTPESAPLHFALGKIHDDCARYAEAFAHYRAGNTIRRATTPFDSAAYSLGVEQIIGTFTAELVKSRSRFGSLSDRHVFIVGMPRSGTTLVEQILASHPLVHGAGESIALFRIVDDIGSATRSAMRYPQAAAELDGPMIESFANQYARAVCAAARPEHRRVTDKNPLNFRHLGLVSMLFPNARIIHCRRDPHDTCLSIYFQYFVQGNPYANDLRDIGRFHVQYKRLMAHWRATLEPGHIDVHYEDLVHQPRETIEALLSFTGLPWDERCLFHEKTRRPIRTASDWQARQPIYSTSVGRWKHYSQFLTPLFEALSEDCTHCSSGGTFC